MRTYSSSRLKNNKIIVALLVAICLISAMAIGIPKTTANKDSSKEPKFRRSDNPILHLSIDEEEWLPIMPPEPVGRPLDEDAEQDLEILIYDIKTKKTKKILKTLTKSDKTTLKVPGSQGSLLSELITESPIGYGDRVRVTPTTDYPWRTICKLLLQFPSGWYMGSGFIVDDYHILTAGHCVYDPFLGEWATSIEIIPALDWNYMPFYHALATSMTVSSLWQSDGWYEEDFAIITLDRNIGDFTGWMGLEYADPSNPIYTGILNTAGYPGDLDDGWNMYSDSDDGYLADEYNHWYWMDTRGGQSGSPVWHYADPGNYVLSIVAYETPPENPNFGTRLSAYWFDLIDWARASSPPPVDYANLIDDGQDWSGFNPTPVVSGVTPFSVWSDISNIGTAESGGFQVSYYASTDTTITASDHLIGTVSIPSITSFTWTNSDWSGTFPNIPAGTYYIGWIIDSTYVVPELLDDGESNNVAYKDSYQLTVEPLPVITYYTNPNDAGSITFNVDDYTDGQSGSYIPNSYTITANAPTGYQFHHWDYDNIGYPGVGVYVPDIGANPGTATVSGDGWLKAVFSALITFRTEPSNIGSITYNGNVYSDGQSIWEVNLPPDNTNIMAITANPSDSYTFSHWDPIGQILVDSPTSITTDLTVNGPGVLTAVFERELVVDYIMTTDYVERDWGEYGDTMIVLGSGATAGAVVNLYWDYVIPAYLMNTTVANPDGSFEFRFDVPEAYKGDHYLWVKDTVTGQSARSSGPFTVVSTITFDVEKGPVGTVVTASGNGFTKSGTIYAEGNITLETGRFAVDTIDGENILISTTGSFTAYIVIPWAPVGVYEVNFTDGTVWASDDFEIDGESVIEVTPGYGPPGTVLTVEGYNFTQISGTKVDLTLESQVAEATTDASGSFTATIVIPALAFGLRYDVTAEDERNCNGTDDVLVVLIVLQLSDFSGPVGSAVTLMGSGFTESGDWNATIGDMPLIETTDIPGSVTYFSHVWYVPSLPSDTYTISVLDIVEEIEVDIDFTLTDQATLSANITQVPNGYNLTLEGTNFVEKDAQATQWYLYNSTHEWDLNPEANVTYGGVVPTTDEFGGFTGYYGVPDFLELGLYTINCTTVSNDPIGEDWEVIQYAELDIEIIIPPLPPILSNLTITPDEVELGDNVTISLDIENIDSQSFTYIVTMQIGELTHLVDVELEPYEYKTVSHTITPDAVGEYNVTVDGMIGSFTVVINITFYSTDYLLFALGHSNTFNVSDDGLSNCTVELVFQNATEGNYLITLTKIGEEGGYWCDSAIYVGEHDGLLTVRGGAPIGNQAHFFSMLYNIPEAFSDGDTWNHVYYDISYEASYVGDITINDVSYSDCILLKFDSTKEPTTYFQGVGEAYLAKDVGIIKFTFNKTDGNHFTATLEEHSDYAQRRISGYFILDSGYPAEGFSVGLSNAVNVGYDATLVDINGSYSLPFYGSSVVLRYGPISMDGRGLMHEHSQEDIINGAVGDIVDYNLTAPDVGLAGPLEERPPELIILPQNVTIPDDRILFNGEAVSVNGLKNVSVNGELASGLFIEIYYFWQKEINLTEGMNDIQITAYDNGTLQKSSSTNLWINYEKDAYYGPRVVPVPLELLPQNRQVLTFIVKPNGTGTGAYLWWAHSEREHSPFNHGRGLGYGYDGYDDITITYDIEDRDGALEVGEEIDYRVHVEGSGYWASHDVITITVGDPDYSLPWVESVSPMPEEQYVPTNSSIDIFFNEQLNHLTLIPDNILLNNETFKGEIEYDFQSHKMTLFPLVPFQQKSKISIELTSGITDYAGNNLTAYSWNFYTYGRACVSIGSVVIAPGQSTEIPVNMSHVTKIAGLGFELYWIPDVVNITGIRLSDDLSATNNSLTVNIDPVIGNATVALVNTHAPEYLTWKEERPVIIVEIQAIGLHGASSILNLENVELSDEYFDLYPPDFVIDGLVTIQDQGNIHGYVTYSYNGAPMEGTTVELSIYGFPLKTAVTDVNGEYEFLDLLLGEYTLTASHERIQTGLQYTTFWNASASANVTTGETTEFDFSLKIRGDMNNQGEVDIGDVAKTANIYVGNIPEEVDLTDFNGNGSLDIGDVAKLANYYVGNIDEV